jgi:hypothetical protein
VSTPTRHPSQLSASSAHGTSASALTTRELLLADAIAERVVCLLDSTPPHGLVDAATVAAALGVSRDYIYAHAAELGGQRIGNGPRGRLRFDLDQALSAWTPRSTSKESQGPQTPVAADGSTHRRQQRLGSSPDLLPIRGATDGNRKRS